MQAKKKFVALNNPAKEILFALSGFGPNIMMVLMGAFFTNAVNPAALSGQAKIVQSITGTCLVLPWLFSILWFLAKCFDGIIDVPFAALTDNWKAKFGRRRTPIAICILPMMLSYALCWIPISTTNQIGNSFWFFAWALTFFATYTMSLVAFYGSLSTTCATDNQRIRVSTYKSIFDTVSYCLVYALVPLILGKTGLHIDKLAFICLPLMFTMIIPLFLIKEGVRWEVKAIVQGYDIKRVADEKPVGFRESIKLTFKNKTFMRWVLVYLCSFFGLQLFLVSMNALITSGMGLTSTHMALLNACAFAPVPVMLHLFNKVRARKGTRLAFQTALLAFATGISAFFLGSKLIMGNYTIIKLLIGIVGSVIGSYAIGAFFMMSYAVPSQISSIEEKLTNKNHSAMYFAIQALFASLVGAIATGLVWENIKTLFFSTAKIGVVKAESFEAAAKLLKVSQTTIYNVGIALVPLIVIGFCIGGFFFSFLMPKDLNGERVAHQLRMDELYQKKKQLFVVNKFSFNVEPLWKDLCLWILSCSLFQYLWFVWLIDDTNTFNKVKTSKWHALGTLIPFYAAYVVYRLNNDVNTKMKQIGLKPNKAGVIFIILACLGLSVIPQSIIQVNLNKIARKLNPKNGRVGL